MAAHDYERIPYLVGFAEKMNSRTPMPAPWISWRWRRTC